MDYIDRNISIVTQGSFNNFCDVYKKIPKTIEEKEEIKVLTKLKFDVMRELEQEYNKKEDITYEPVSKNRVQQDMVMGNVFKKMANGMISQTNNKEISQDEIPF